MKSDAMDAGRRQFLTAATSVVGGVGLGLAAVPFVGSWLPSAKARSLGGPVEIDLSKIDVGQKITVPWRGQPIFVIHRSDETLRALEELPTHMLRDPESKLPQQPDYINQSYRAIEKKFLVLVGLCTHLGCVPLYKPKIGSLETGWKGGFFCPCHGSKFDLSGRVFKGVPAPTNLEIPPYRYESEHVIVIGEDPVGVA